MCFCSVPLLPHHRVLSPTHTPRFSSPAIDKNLHWGRFIMECMTWFVSSLGWRPISLTSTRQILFDISLCQGMCNLAVGRYFVSWESKHKTHTHTHTHTHTRSKYQNMLSFLSTSRFASRKTSFYNIEGCFLQFGYSATVHSSFPEINMTALSHCSWA